MADTTSKSVSIRKDTKKEESKPVPKGAEIVSENVSTDVEQIENGFLITKRTEIRWKTKGMNYPEYSYENKKYFSKTDPLTINVKDKGLAEAFEE